MRGKGQRNQREQILGCVRKARGKNSKQVKCIELRGERSKVIKIIHDDDDGRSSAVHGLGPVHQRSFLGTNPCAPETPIR